MARRYYVTDTNSDLSAGGLYNYYTEYSTPTSTFNQVVSLASVTSTFGYVFTRPLHPGAMTTSTSNYTANLDVSVTNTNIVANVQIHRINSTGTVQSSSTVTADQTLGANRSFSFASLDLGTFSSTDRIRIDYGFRNTQHNTQSATLLFADADSLIYIDSFYPLTAQFT